MSDEEEDENLFIPDQSFALQESKEKIQKLDNEAERLKSLISQKRRLVSNLKSQHALMKGAEDGYILYIEQIRARRQPWWWFVMLIVSFICILGQWDKGNKILAFLNIFAHKLLWRRMYVETNVPSQLVALCVVAYTFLFG